MCSWVICPAATTRRWRRPWSRDGGSPPASAGWCPTPIHGGGCGWTYSPARPEAGRAEDKNGAVLDSRPFQTTRGQRTDMDLIARISRQFEDSIAAKQNAMELLAAPLAATVETMTACLLGNGKNPACGNDGSAADAQHFAAELVNRFEMERPPLAAIALTTDTSTLTSIANDYDYSQVASV